MAIDENIKLLMQSLGEQIVDETDKTGDASKVQETLALLIEETTKFRDKLLEDRGVEFTVDDTQETLLALDEYMSTGKIVEELSMEQHALLQIWIDRLTIFGKD